MITKIEALSYRCLRYIEQELQPFQILVGPNASGKSTFLDIMAFLSDLLTDGLTYAIRMRANSLEELLWKGEGNRFELAIEIKIPEILRQKSSNGKYSSCRYQIAIGKNQDKETVILSETLWLRGENGQGKQLVPTQFTMFPMEITPPPSLIKTRQNWRTVVNKSEAGNDYFHSEKTEWNNIFKIGPLKPALANLPEDEEKFPISSWVKRFLMKNIQQVALNSVIMRSPSSPLHTKRLFYPDGSNIPLIVKSLKDEHNDKFKRWLKHIQTVLKDLDNIEVVERPEDRHLYLVGVYKPGIRVPSWLLSDGTLRLLALTLLAYIPNEHQVYLIEEPENGIHPRAAEAVYQSLSSMYDSQVFLATHSPIILSVAKPENILCFGKNPSGSIAIIRGNEHPGLRNWQGSPDLSVLYASGILG